MEHCKVTSAENSINTVITDTWCTSIIAPLLSMRNLLHRLQICNEAHILAAVKVLDYTACLCGQEFAFLNISIQEIISGAKLILVLLIISCAVH